MTNSTSHGSHGSSDARYSIVKLKGLKAPSCKRGLCECRNLLQPELALASLETHPDAVVEPIITFVKCSPGSGNDGGALLYLMLVCKGASVLTFCAFLLDGRMSTREGLAEEGEGRGSVWMAGKVVKLAVPASADSLGQRSLPCLAEDSNHVVCRRSHRKGRAQKAVLAEVEDPGSLFHARGGAQ